MASVQVPLPTSGVPWFGSHVSTGGGLHSIFQKAHNHNLSSLAFFVKNSRSWKSPPLDSSDIDLFKREMEKHSFSPKQILPHASYLINLGSPNPEKLEKSRNLAIDEMTRCQQLGLNLYNFHPGASLKEISDQQCLQQISESIQYVLDRTKGVTAVLENTAGQGSTLGHQLEHLSEIYSLTPSQYHSRMGVCIDTCHTFAAGYDISTPQGYQAFWERFDQLGLDLKGMHINDSKTTLGSRKDRHENLGEGYIGMDCFRMILGDERLVGIPLILEIKANPTVYIEKVFQAGPLY